MGIDARWENFRGSRKNISVNGGVGSAAANKATKPTDTAHCLSLGMHAVLGSPD